MWEKAAMYILSGIDRSRLLYLLYFYKADNILENLIDWHDFLVQRLMRNTELTKYEVYLNYSISN